MKKKVAVNLYGIIPIQPYAKKVDHKPNIKKRNNGESTIAAN